ncbi:zinc finger protein 540-like [Plodia interpunctella]|uniref:zinc finger protein 540-like n=1 Tax=Plodia interpunctella TaxID=58824 RepID=UPI002368880A|nr:zinc finger protein 540-like [Plodia interpunctella]
MTSLLLLKSMLYANAIQQQTHKKKKSKLAKSTAAKEIKVVLCRVCNEEKGDIPIFNNMTQPDIPEEINNITGVMISMSDSFSKFMCQKCLDLLNGCITFRKMCQKTHELLLELSIKKEKCNNEQKIDEIIETGDPYYVAPSPTYSDDNTQLCMHCNKGFGDMVSYNVHLTKCSGNKIRTRRPDVLPRGSKMYKKNYLCDICGKIAFSNAQLLQHKSIHNNVFPFKCDICPYQGRTLDLLKVHKRSHLADKPFKCTQCPKSTTTSSNLSKHMRHVHSNNRPYKCSFCDKAFSYQHDMNRHVRDVHLRQNVVECDVCFKKFNTRKILQGHRSKVHKIKGERQGRLPSYLQCQMNSSEKDMILYNNDENEEEATPE